MRSGEPVSEVLRHVADSAANVVVLGLRQGGPGGDPGSVISPAICSGRSRSRFSRSRSNPARLGLDSAAPAPHVEFMETELPQLEAAIRLAVAGLAGMAVGLEREWSGHATGPDARFAGVRTFFLLGILGGVAGVASRRRPAGRRRRAAPGRLGPDRRGVSHRGTPDPQAIDGTTEAAALLVLGTGLLAGRGSLALASGIVAVTVLLLGEKEAIRAFIKRIGREEMFAALRFAVLALVVLPLLPEGPLGPFGGIRPRSLWMVVLIFSAINFVGYVVRRSLGDTRGYLATGALGGLVSSTAVTLTFSRQSRTDEGDAPALAAGTVAACTVLVLRVLTVILVLNAALAPAVASGSGPCSSSEACFC